MLTPSRLGGFAANAVARVGQGPIGRHQSGPYDICWEGNDRQELEAVWDQLGIVDGRRVDEALQTLSTYRHLPVVRSLRNWLIRRRSTSGLEIVAAAELERQLDRALTSAASFRRQARRTTRRDDNSASQEPRVRSCDRFLATSRSRRSRAETPPVVQCNYSGKKKLHCPRSVSGDAAIATFRFITNTTISSAFGLFGLPRGGRAVQIEFRLRTNSQERELRPTIDLQPMHWWAFPPLSALKSRSGQAGWI